MLFDSICDNTKCVIDIGLGYGLFIEDISKKVKSVLSINISPIKMEKTKEYFENLHINNFTFQDTSIYSIDRESNSFDIAVFYKSIDHIPNYYLALQEGYRVLNSKGIIYINTINTSYSTKKTKNLDDFIDFEHELFDFPRVRKVREDTKVDIEKLYIQLGEIGFSNILSENNKTGNVEILFERIDQDTKRLLENIRKNNPNDYSKYYDRYNELLDNVKRDGVEFRPTIEIVGVK
jgi:ubiquinone/menaquinone biosynthesis C-methylase UbiE